MWISFNVSKCDSISISFYFSTILRRSDSISHSAHHSFASVFICFDLNLSIPPQDTRLKQSASTSFYWHNVWSGNPLLIPFIRLVVLWSSPRTLNNASVDNEAFCEFHDKKGKKGRKKQEEMVLDADRIYPEHHACNGYLIFLNYQITNR